MVTAVGLRSRLLSMQALSISLPLSSSTTFVTASRTDSPNFAFAGFTEERGRGSGEPRPRALRSSRRWLRVYLVVVVTTMATFVIGSIPTNAVLLATVVVLMLMVLMAVCAL